MGGGSVSNGSNSNISTTDTKGGLSLRPPSYPGHGHKRAMSYQYVGGGSNSSNGHKLSDSKSTTAANLGLDFPPSYYVSSNGGTSIHATSSSCHTRVNSNGGGACNLSSPLTLELDPRISSTNSKLTPPDRGVLIEVSTPIKDAPTYQSVCESMHPEKSEKLMREDESKVKLHSTSSKSMRNEIKKTFLAFVFQQAAQLLMIWTVVKSNDRMDLESPVLPDIVLDRVPVVKWAGQWSEILLFTLFLLFIAVILFHKHRFLVLRRILAVAGICLIIRSFCVWATVLPRSLGSMECAPKSRNSAEVIHRVFIMYVTSGLSIFGGHMCGNYFFSGHTCLMTVIHCAFYQYTPDCISPIKKLATVLCLTISVFILLAHNHYTLDVLGAYYVASRVWMFYHFLAHNPQYRVSSQLNLCWSWLVNIFEDGSEGTVKNELQSLSEIYRLVCQETDWKPKISQQLL